MRVFLLLLVALLATSTEAQAAWERQGYTKINSFTYSELAAGSGQPGFSFDACNTVGQSGLCNRVATLSCVKDTVNPFRCREIIYAWCFAPANVPGVDCFTMAHRQCGLTAKNAICRNVRTEQCQTLARCSRLRCAHTVTRSDTLSKIASWYKLTLQELLDIPGNEQFKANPSAIRIHQQVMVCRSRPGVSIDTIPPRSISLNIPTPSIKIPPINCRQGMRYDWTTKKCVTGTPCKADEQMNPKTNRCEKVVSPTPRATPPLPPPVLQKPECLTQCESLPFLKKIKCQLTQKKCPKPGSPPSGAPPTPVTTPKSNPPFTRRPIIRKHFKYEREVAERCIWLNAAGACDLASLWYWECRPCTKVGRHMKILCVSWDPITSTFGYVGIFTDTNEIVFSFRSREVGNTAAWLANADSSMLDAGMTKAPGYEGVKIHKGFAQAWINHWANLEFATYQVLIGLEAQDFTITFTGHSLGGAIATVAAADLAARHPDVAGVSRLITFGAPRVGNDKFAALLDNLSAYWRVTHGADPCPTLPPRKPFGYVHGGQEVYYTDFTRDPMMCTRGIEDGRCILRAKAPRERDHLDYFLENCAEQCDAYFDVNTWRPITDKPDLAVFVLPQIQQSVEYWATAEDHAKNDKHPKLPTTKPEDEGKTTMGVFTTVEEYNVMLAYLQGKTRIEEMNMGPTEKEAFLDIAQYFAVKQTPQGPRLFENGFQERPVDQKTPPPIPDFGYKKKGCGKQGKAEATKYANYFCGSDIAKNDGTARNCASRVKGYLEGPKHRKGKDCKKDLKKTCRGGPLNDRCVSVVRNICGQLGKCKKCGFFCKVVKVFKVIIKILVKVASIYVKISMLIPIPTPFTLVGQILGAVYHAAKLIETAKNLVKALKGCKEKVKAKDPNTGKEVVVRVIKRCNSVWGAIKQVGGAVVTAAVQGAAHLTGLGDAVGGWVNDVTDSIVGGATEIIAGVKDKLLSVPGIAKAVQVYKVAREVHGNIQTLQVAIISIHEADFSLSGLAQIANGISNIAYVGASTARLAGAKPQGFWGDVYKVAEKTQKVADTVQDWADRTQAVINGVTILKNGKFQLSDFPANVAQYASALNQLSWGLRCNKGAICQVVGKVGQVSGKVEEKTLEIMDKIERAAVSYHVLRTVWSGGDPLQAVASLGDVAANLGYIVNNGKLQLAGEKIGHNARISQSLVAEFQTWNPVPAPDSPLCWSRPCDKSCATPPSNPICTATDEGKVAPNCIRGRECFCIAEPEHKLCTRSPKSAYCQSNFGDPACIRGAEKDKIDRGEGPTPGWVSPVLNPKDIPLPEDQQKAWDAQQKKSGASSSNSNSNSNSNNDANDKATGKKVIDARSTGRGQPICPPGSKLKWNSVNRLADAYCVTSTGRKVPPASYHCPGNGYYDQTTKLCSWKKGWRPPSRPGRPAIGAGDRS